MKRNSIRYLQQLWCNSTIGERLQWQSFAAFAKVPQKNNPARFLNGQQLFIQINVNLQTGGKDLMLSPVFVPNTLVPINFTMYDEMGRIYLGSDRNITVADEFVLLFMSPPLSNGIMHTSVNMRSIDMGTLYGLRNYNITGGYVAVYAVSPWITMNILYKYKVVSLLNGLSSPWRYMSFLS
jgi:hypothetical protein